MQAEKIQETLIQKIDKINKELGNSEYILLSKNNCIMVNSDNIADDLIKLNIIKSIIDNEEFDKYIAYLNKHNIKIIFKNNELDIDYTNFLTYIFDFLIKLENVEWSNKNYFKENDLFEIWKTKNKNYFKFLGKTINKDFFNQACDSYLKFLKNCSFEYKENGYDNYHLNNNINNNTQIFSCITFIVALLFNNYINEMGTYGVSYILSFIIGVIILAYLPYLLFDKSYILSFRKMVLNEYNKLYCNN